MASNTENFLFDDVIMDHQGAHAPLQQRDIFIRNRIPSSLPWPLKSFPPILAQHKYFRFQEDGIPGSLGCRDRLEVHASGDIFQQMNSACSHNFKLEWHAEYSMFFKCGMSPYSVSRCSVKLVLFRYIASHDKDYTALRTTCPYNWNSHPSTLVGRHIYTEMASRCVGFA